MGKIFNYPKDTNSELLKQLSIYEGNEGKNLIKNIQGVSSGLTLISTDNTYKGSFVEDAKALGYQIEFGQKPESTKGFVPQKDCWQGQRALAWLNPFRRLSKDYEKIKGRHPVNLR